MMPQSLPMAQGEAPRIGRVDRPQSRAYPARVLLPILITLLLGLSGCAGTRGRGREVPLPLTEQQERVIGGRLAARFELEVRPGIDPVVNDYVNNIGQRIARLSDRPEIPYDIRVMADSTPTAVAFPGGRIYLSTGLLLRIDTESQLAGVIGHEIAHVAARDPTGVVERGLEDAELASILRGPRGPDATTAGAKALKLLGVGYGHEVERQADLAALLYASRIGVNPDGIIRAIESLNPSPGGKELYWEPIAKGHLPLAERVFSLRAELKSMGLDAGLPTDPRPYAAIKLRIK